MSTPCTGPQGLSPVCSALIYSLYQHTLSWAGTFTAIQLDELRIPDITQPIFNSFIHQAEDILHSQQLPCPTGVGTRDQLQYPLK